MANIHRSAIAFILAFIFLSSLAYAVSYSYGKTTMYFKSRCSFIMDSELCINAGCYWWDDSCHPFQQVISEETENCFKLDDEITLCITNLNRKYLIIDTGEYGVVAR